MMTIKIFLLCLSLVFTAEMNLTANAAAIDSFKDEKGVLRIAGGTAHIPVMKEAAKRIMQLNPDIRISIAGGGSGVGIKQVGDGLVDIGNSGRKPTHKELERYNLKMFKWAIDGVAIIVNPDNPVKMLDSEQIKHIYSGKISNWKTVGGTDKPINLYTRDNSSGTWAVFWKNALNKGDVSTKANFVSSNGAMKVSVSSDRYGIGYVSVGFIDNMVAPVTFNGILPSLEMIKQGKYKIARGLYSNTKGEPKGLTKKFIDYLFTEECRQIISDKGFIPVN
jgi:phosphate transport system substrate-binding protein